MTTDKSTTPRENVTGRRLATFTFVLLLILLGTSVASATPEKVMRLKKIDSPIVVDGLEETLWSQADSISDFHQFSPYHGTEPSKKTVAKILSTDHSLYCLILCWDEKSNIQRNTGMLDDFGGDLVSLMIDTFCDNRTAYKFAVSASGVRADCRLVDDARNRDYSWDGVWFSAAKIHEWGFAVEMEIPYRSILYDEKLTEWGLDVDRWIPTLNEDIYWCKYEENEGLRVSKFGRLIFDESYPSVRGLNLEVYPVGILKADYLRDSKYDVSPNAGVDIFYNPSQRLTFQLTANPDFAQIEADPFDFNITRYESYFDERRPFFTEGKEVFMPSGRERSSGFYTPLELFYSRRIGKKLPDGSEVPLLVGAKAVGRISGWEYGGFLAMTGEKDYTLDDEPLNEPRAVFSSVRIKRQILENSSIGVLYVGKTCEDENTGVIDIDGAFRSADWQLSYQVARSYKGSEGDFAASAGLMLPKEKWMAAVRSRYVGEDFDVNQVGFVPWKGTGEFTALAGPRWYFDEGYIKQVMVYSGGLLNFEKVDDFTDRIGTIGVNMQFRNNWGYEVSFLTGRAKELDKEFTLYEVDVSSWASISPRWEASMWGSFAKSYNFTRDYLAYFTVAEGEMEWHALDILDVGTSASLFIETDPDNKVEEVTINTRPFLSVTPVNDLSVRLYLDNVYLRSSGQIQQVIGGLLFSYNFRPKSWIYLAINEVRDRSDEYDSLGMLLPNRLHVADRALVVKLKYLFYF